MSDTASAGKAPQTGLVDMGDIDFYNDPSISTPPFTIDDLQGYAGSFSEIVLNVTWADLQPDPGGPIDTGLIDADIALLDAYNLANGTDVGIKLRVWGGYTAPDWAKSIDGPPITVTGDGTIDPNKDQTETIGRFWTADYIDAWTSFQTALAKDFDTNSMILGISNTAGASASDEPFVPLHPAQVTELQAGGYTDAAEELTLRNAIADYTAWSTTPLDYTMNLFHLEDSGKVVSDANVTLAVLQEAEGSSRTVQAGNHALNSPPSTGDSFVYYQLADDAALNPSTVPASFQTASPVNLGSNYANWEPAIAQGVTSDAGDIELWDGPGDTGFTGASPTFVAGLAGTLADGIAPTTGAPDDGAALGFIAPASVTGAPGAIAFTGTDAVLLASATSQTSYTITITSADGNVLTVKDALIAPQDPMLPVTPVTIIGADALTLTPPSGAQDVSSTSLTFTGSLAVVDTILASLTDTVAAGTDVITVTATDSSNDTATQSVGVSATDPAPDPDASPDPQSAPMAAAVSYTWSGLGTTPLYANAMNWSPAGGPPGVDDTAIFSGDAVPTTVAGPGVAGTLVVNDTVVPGGGSDIAVGQGTTGDLDIADAAKTQGTLLLAGVNTTLSVAGNFAIGGTASAAGGTGTLLAALSPSDSSTATLTVGGTLQVWSQGTARFTGALTAGAIDNTAGLISGDGTVTATGGEGIVNTGTIEAAADQTAGSQELTVASPITGAGTLLIDAAATLILDGTVDANQALVFAAPTIDQFSDDPYSPTTLELESPVDFGAPITGFSFADSLVLDDVTATSATYDPTTDLLTVDITANGSAAPPLTFTVTGDLAGLTPVVAVTGTNTDPITTVTFVAAGLGQPPSIVAPATLDAAVDVAVPVPDIVLNTPLPAAPGDNTTVIVTLTAGATQLMAGSDNGNTTITTINQLGAPGTPGSETLILAGTLGAVETSLQSLSYTGLATGAVNIDLTVSDYFGTSDTATITVTNSTAGTEYDWSGGGQGDLADAGNWQVAGAAVTTAPGGADIAAFGAGTFTVGGYGAVGRLTVGGDLTLTGSVNAQGLTAAGAVGQGTAAIVNGGALTLSAGATLTAGATSVVGFSGTGLLTVASGALTLIGTGTDLVLGQNAASQGTVLDLEQIEAVGTVVVGAAGTGTLRLLGAAASLTDAGTDIGQGQGAVGLGVVDGGEFATQGALTVGDAGTGSLLIGGAANGITGQATAFDATIGAQAGGAGTITVTDADLLVANAEAESSTLAVGAGGAGTLALANGANATIGVALATVSGTGGSSTNYDNTGTLAVGVGGAGMVTIGADSSLEVDGGATIAGTVVVGQTATDTALLAMTGTLAVAATGEVSLGGPLATVRASAVTIAAGGSLSGAGTLSGDGGGNGTVMRAGITNDGLIAATGGTLLVYGAVAGTGMLAAQADTALTLQAAVGSGQTLTFGAAALATLDDVGAFQGTITGFAVGDILDLASTEATGALWNDGTLTLATAGAPIVLNVAGDYAANAFSVKSDMLGGTDVELGVSVACFAAGTRIRTPSGLRDVAALSVGDHVLTLSGAIKPIRWLGNRHVDCRRHPDPRAVWPVRVCRDAFGPGAPLRDLFLSPDHAVYAEGVLIPVKHLLNGSTIRQEQWASVIYYHLELDEHDVVLAEDLPAETFLDTGNRGVFAVVQRHAEIPSDSISWRWEAQGYAPLRITGAEVERVKRRLMPIAISMQPIPSAAFIANF
jgi:T5SS/PEP-CTERM-associated repeat protein